VKTYREKLAEELERWEPFRRALIREERRMFDSLVDNSLRYAGGAEALRERDVYDLLIMTSLLSHEERLDFLEKELRARMRVDGRLL